MNIHLKGPFFLTQTLLPLIADGGRIVNISTDLARFALPGKAASPSTRSLRVPSQPTSEVAWCATTRR